MRFELCVDGRRPRHWHVALLDRVSRRPGVTASLRLAAAGRAHNRVGGLLLGFDGVIHGVRGAMTAPAHAEALSPYRCRPAEPIDIVLDLCRDADPGAGGQVWHLTFDGFDGHDLPLEDALLAMLLDGRSPLAQIRQGGQIIATARLGAEHPGTLLPALEDVLTRTISFIDAALAGTAQTVTQMLPEPPPPATAAPFGVTRVGKVAARTLVFSAIRRVYKYVYDSPHWRVGWRRLDGPDLFDLQAHPEAGWTLLPDDGRRFYADPFPIVHDGALTVFLEEFPHRTGKGVISALRFDADGPVGRPEPVLERPYHLSYPFVFARDGEIWMIPETCAAATVELYRATSFPDGWTKEATLVSGVVASDATLIEHEGRWWMFATVRDGGGAFSDTLYLWWAEDFRGPWTPHQANPVMIDIAAARPAGRMLVRNGALLRPVQDCRHGYGRALGIARVTQLDQSGFRQVLETLLTAGPLWPGNRLHTLNAAGGFEFIDGSARVRRRILG